MSDNYEFDYEDSKSGSYKRGDSDYKYSERSSYERGDSKYRSGYRYSKVDLLGITVLGVNFNEFSLVDPKRDVFFPNVYPIGDLTAVTAFDVRRKDFETVAYFDLDGFQSSDTIDLPFIGGLDIPAGINLADYDVAVAVSAEGRAFDITGDKYADKFFTDEIEIYYGLINDSVAGVPVVAAVEIDIELNGKVDILIGEQQSIYDILAVLSANGGLDQIEEIEIKYQYDQSNPLALAFSGRGEIRAQISAAIAAYDPGLVGLIEFEQDDVKPTGWAAYAFGVIQDNPGLFVA